jgi:hypothetical protein
LGELVVVAVNVLIASVRDARLVDVTLGEVDDEEDKESTPEPD